MINFDEIKKAQFIEDFRRAELLGREDEFLKSFGIDIEKAAGEGSRGGKVIGHTRSGKPIYEVNREELKKDRLHLGDKYRVDKYHKDHFPHFTSKDHEEAKKKHFDFESTEESKNASFNEFQNNRTIGHYHQEMAKKKAASEK